MGFYECRFSPIRNLNDSRFLGMAGCLIGNDLCSGLETSRQRVIRLDHLKQEHVYIHIHGLTLDPSEPDIANAIDKVQNVISTVFPSWK